MTGVKPSAWSLETINTIAQRVRSEVLTNTPNIHSYVTAYADLPLGIASTDPEIGDLVGVNTTTGTWILGTQRRMGFYKRIALTGVVATDYGTSPFTGFTPFAPNQITGVTLLVGSWSLVSGLYEYTYSNALITENSIVEFIPDNEFMTIVKAAEILPRTDSATGSVKVYASNAPTGDIGVTINITEKA